MKGGGTKCQTLGWWQMNEAVLKQEKKSRKKKSRFFFSWSKITWSTMYTRYENDSTT